MYHIDGRLVSPEPGPRACMEGAIAAATGLRLVPGGNCREFWVIGRRSLPVVYLTERLTGRRRPGAAPGSLSPELAALLVSASEPTPDDVFMDPFAGSGALVRARLRLPAREVLYNDLAYRRYRDLFEPATARRIRFLAEDALRLPSVASGTVDTIVTDPPWGEHERGVGDYGRFAERMLRSFARVLRPDGGRIVVLVNPRNEDTLAHALVAAPAKVGDTFRLLVNGRPATVICARL